MDAWEALKEAGGTVPENRAGYDPAQWELLYNAVREGRINAFGMPESGMKEKDISDLFDAIDHVNAWHNTAKFSGWGVFYNVSFKRGRFGTAAEVEAAYQAWIAEAPRIRDSAERWAMDRGLGRKRGRELIRMFGVGRPKT